MKSLFVFSDPSQIFEEEIKKENATVIALTKDVNKKLIEKNIPFKIPNDYLKKVEFRNIPRESINFVRKIGEIKIDNETIKEHLTIDGISFWEVIENNLSDLLFQGADTIQKIKIYQKIITSEKPEKIITFCDGEIIKAVVDSQRKQIEIISKSQLLGLNNIKKIFNDYLYRHLIKLKYGEREIFAKKDFEENDFKKNKKKIVLIPTTESEIPIFLPIYNKLKIDKNIIVIDIPSVRDRIKKVLAKNKIDATPLEKFFSKNVKKNANKKTRCLIEVWDKIKKRDEIKKITYSGVNVWSILENYIDFYFHGRRRMKEVVLNAEAANEIMIREKPDMIIIADDMSEIGKPISIQARKYSIPVVAIQHGLIGRKSMPFGPSYVSKMAVWSEDIKRKLCRNGFRKEQLVITGCSKFDNIKLDADKNELFRRLNLDEKDKIALFISQPTAYTQTIAPFIFRTMKEFSEYRLVVKLHPREYSEEFYKSLEKKVELPVTIIKDVDIFDIISASEFVIAASSTVGLETVILGKPFILLNFSYEPDPVPYAEENVAIGVYKEGDLKEAIKSLKVPEVVLKLKRGREKFLRKHLYKLDGKSSERIVKVINDILENRYLHF